MSSGHVKHETELFADDRLEKVVTNIATRKFPSPSSGNTYIGFRLRSGRLRRELLVYISIYRKRFDCYPNDLHLTAAGECIYPLFEKREDWKNLASPRTESLIVDEISFGQIQQMADLHMSLLPTHD